MTLTRRIDSLVSQLNMALAKNPPSAIQIAMLKAQIKELKAQVEREAGA